jgi:ABC-type lipoprotein export system ATPase subunit
LDGKTNINLPFYFKKLPRDTKWKQQLIHLFKAQNLLSKNIESLSAWEKEKIWIIKAFIHKPKLVLLDETWNSLHQELKEKLIDFVKDYSKKHIVFWISHDYFITSQLKSSNIVYNWNFTIYKS